MCILQLQVFHKPVLESPFFARLRKVMHEALIHLFLFKKDVKLLLHPGPLHMSPVDHSGPGTKLSPHFYLLFISICSYEWADQLVAKILVVELR